jgi:NAD(P)-dependent dehydrogenase (short-subunit alcohol dehydrogenase family)
VTATACWRSRQTHAAPAQRAIPWRLASFGSMPENRRVAVVTGATGGLGAAVAAALRDAGLVVAGFARHGTDEGVDVTDEQQVQAAVSRVVAKHGRIDALVNVAGGFAGGQPVQQTNAATWEHMLALNLTSTFLCCKAVLPHMLTANHGRIVNVSSRAGVQPTAGLSAYNVSKAGVIVLSQTLAAELSGHDVTCNVILPSVIDTATNRQAMSGADHSRWVQPMAIAAIVLDLISDRWGIVNGATIPVYGEA